MSEPLVHVLVINWNGIQHLRECFESLIAGTHANARFVLIDNASTDGSVTFVREQFGADPRVEFIECETNLGWSGGNNAGIERAMAAGAEYVFLLNNDTVTAPDAVEHLVRAAEECPETGALAPKMLLYDTPGIINSVGIECSIIGCSWDLGLGRLDGPRWDVPRKVLGVCGGAAFYRVGALRKVGLLPSDFVIYLDDLDLCLRMWSAGLEVWSCPRATVRHKFSATMGEGKAARRKYYLNTRNRLRLMSRNFPASKLPLALAAFKIGEARAIGRAILDREPWRALAHVRGWGAALAYAPRALSERIRQRRSGFAPHRFWPLVRTDRMFYPGVDLPVDGWYPARQAGGKTVRPMSARAWIETDADVLRVTHADCYPHLGPAGVEVRQDGETLAVLETLGCEEAVVEVSPGVVEFVASRVFEAEQTGERMDIGGWVGVEPRMKDETRI